MNLLERIGLKSWNSSSFFIAVAGFNALLMVICSYKLWSSIGRNFYKTPLVPIESYYSVDIVLFVFLLISLLSIVLKQSRKLLFVVLCIFTIFILLDIHRLQIWVYQAMLIFSVPLLAKEEKQRVRLFTIVLGGTYLWAGLHKINWAFLDVVYPWFMGTYTFTKPLVSLKFLAIIPIITEISLGVLVLLSGRFMKYAFYLSVIFHAGILFFLGPWGSGWNFIVYPWNILSPVLVWCLYKGQTVEKETFKISPVLSFYVLLCLFLPALYLFNLYPGNLSFGLYTGKTDYAFFTTYDNNGNIRNRENIGAWANKDLDIPHFKSDWVHKELAKKHIQVKNDNKSRGLLMVKYKNPILSNERERLELRFSK